VLSYDALADGMSADALIERIMRRVPAPEKPLQTHVNVADAVTQS
jgi:MoxR-like ATPase